MADSKIALLDIARKRFTKDEIISFIDAISEAGGESFILHFSDDENYSLPSTILGALETTEKNHVLTKEEIKEIVDYAEEKNINIIPELELPAHNNKLLDLLHASNHELWDKVYTKKGGYRLNTSAPEALQLIKDLFDEVEALFPYSTVFHFGGDEFEYGEENTEDSVTKFYNAIAEYVTGKGAEYILVWNDFITKDILLEDKLDKENIRILYWSQTGMVVDGDEQGRRREKRATMEELITEGFDVYNANGYYLYSVPRANEVTSHNALFAAREVIQDWSIGLWDENNKENKITRPESLEKIKGVVFSVWNENSKDLPADFIIKSRKDHMKAVFTVWDSADSIDEKRAELNNVLRNLYIRSDALPERHEHEVFGQQNFVFMGSLSENARELVLTKATNDAQVQADGVELISKDSIPYLKHLKVTIPQELPSSIGTREAPDEVDAALALVNKPKVEESEETVSPDPAPESSVSTTSEGEGQPSPTDDQTTDQNDQGGEAAVVSPEEDHGDEAGAMDQDSSTEEKKDEEETTSPDAQAKPEETVEQPPVVTETEDQHDPMNEDEAEEVSPAGESTVPSTTTTDENPEAPVPPVGVVDTNNDPAIDLSLTPVKSAFAALIGEQLSDYAEKMGIGVLLTNTEMQEQQRRLNRLVGSIVSTRAQVDFEESMYKLIEVVYQNRERAFSDTSRFRELEAISSLYMDINDKERLQAVVRIVCMMVDESKHDRLRSGYNFNSITRTLPAHQAARFIQFVKRYVG